MFISNSKIYKDRIKELPLNTLASSLDFTKSEKASLKRCVSSLKIIGVIDKDIAEPSDGVELIYLLEMRLKTDEVPTDFMTAFDKQTKAHTMWEVPWEGEYVFYEMAKKKIKDGNVSVDTYYATDPDMYEFEIKLKNGETLGDIYANLYSYVVGLKRRKGETADDIRERSKRIRDLEKQLDKLERNKKRESQLNKKASINEQIRAIMHQIEGETN